MTLGSFLAALNDIKQELISEYGLNLLWPVSTHSRHVVDFVFGYVCLSVCELQSIISRELGCRGVGRAASWPWLRGAAAQETRQSTES